MNVLYNMKKLKSRMQNRGWISSDILPTESGDYLCFTSPEYDTKMVLHYSDKHKAFNAYDSIKNENPISVEYWRPLPKSVKSAKRDWKQIATKVKQIALMALSNTMHILALCIGVIFVVLLLEKYCPWWGVLVLIGVELFAFVSVSTYREYKTRKGEDNDGEQ